MHKLISARSQTILLDACSIMVGINKQSFDPDYSFENMRSVYLDALFEYFQDILIHDTVWEELDDIRKEFITSNYLGKNVRIVSENEWYGVDPMYTDLFNKIASFDLFRYRRMDKRNKGDVFSLAYAAHCNIPFLSTRDGSVIMAIQEIPSLSMVELLGFEHILMLGYVRPNHGQPIKRFRSIYKAQCSPSINSKLIPDTFTAFINTQIP
jgi:hypothetical protein